MPCKLSRQAQLHANSITDGSCRFILGTEEKPFSGGECKIFALGSETNVKVAIRIPHQLNHQKIEAEVVHLQALKDAKIPDVPQLLQYSYEPQPFIALKWADGTAMTWTDTSPEIESRKLILESVAKINMNILKINNPSSNAWDWIHGKISRTRIARAANGNLGDVSVKDCELLLDGLQKFHIDDLNHAPSVLVHGDEQPSNIIINDKEICLIDWGFATMIPLQYAAVYPRFLTDEPQITGGEVTWPNETAAMRRDRAVYLACIKAIALDRGGIYQDYYNILARSDEVLRYWWLSAVGRMDIMKAWVASVKDRKPVIVEWV